jgi:hypothetical protein
MPERQEGEKKLSRKKQAQKRRLEWLGGEAKLVELLRWQKEQDERYRNKDSHNCPVLYGHF